MKTHKDQAAVVSTCGTSCSSALLCHRIIVHVLRQQTGGVVRTIWFSVRKQTGWLKDTINIEQLWSSPPVGIKGCTRSIVHTHTGELTGGNTSDRWKILISRKLEDGPTTRDRWGSLVLWLNYTHFSPLLQLFRSFSWCWYDTMRGDNTDWHAASRTNSKGKKHHSCVKTD